MKTRAIVVSSVVIAVLTCFFLGALLIGDASNAIDNIHWQGTPLPPCFINAQLCGGHVLGTDAVGRDLLARLIVGGAVTLAWSLAVLIVEAVLTTLVALAARFGGRVVRYAALRVADALSAIPQWPVMILVVILWRHLSPGVAAAALMAPSAIRMSLGSPAWPTLADRAARDWQRIIILMATIDFFGYGVMPPTASWGNMLVEAQTSFQIAWWAAVFPATSLTALVLSIELLRRSFLRGGTNNEHRNIGAT
jgi:peptide/nickel transport system permease protein